MPAAPPGRQARVSRAQLRALRLDAAAARMARSWGALDLAIGETLAQLFRGSRLLQLGHAREVDYARERLGVRPRTMYGWVRLARGLAERPVLRRAVRAGAVTPRKALTVMPVATGEAERAWTAAAMTRPLRDLEAAVRAEGAVPIDELEFESVVLRMAPGEQARLDAALALADEILGFGAPRWQLFEAMGQEWLGEHGGPVPEERERAGAPPPPDEALARRLAEIESSLAGIHGEEDEHDPLPDDAPSLDARAMRLLAARRGYDELFGMLADALVRHDVPRHLGFRTLAEYCRDRLGMSPRSLRERVWLERRMCALPALRAALAAGKISYSKALLVAKDATPRDVERRIEEAAQTTWQQVDRECTAAEERRNRAAGVRRLWGPKAAMEVVAAAIVSAQARAAAAGVRLDAGAALAVVADHCVAVWTAHLRGRRKTPRVRRQVMLRHGGLCGVPGCSRPARHEHHITHRAHGGTDDAANRVALCVAHHLHGVHKGYLAVSGRAGERLVWRLGRADHPVGGVWVTLGNDRVRRAAAGAPEPEPIGASG